MHIADVLRRFAVEMLSGTFGIGAALVNDTITMIGWGVERVKLLRYGPSVDDIVVDCCRNKHGKAGLNRYPILP